MTETDGRKTQPPDFSEDRFFSDLLVCHPSADGFRAHRDRQRGSWYLELICKVFMEHAHDTDVQTMLKLVENDLQKRISEIQTKQTSSVTDKAFRICYLNPGIYEEDGQIKQFENST